MSFKDTINQARQNLVGNQHISLSLGDEANTIRVVFKKFEISVVFGDDYPNGTGILFVERKLNIDDIIEQRLMKINLAKRFWQNIVSDIVDIVYSNEENIVNSIKECIQLPKVDDDDDNETESETDDSDDDLETETETASLCSTISADVTNESEWKTKLATDLRHLRAIGFYSGYVGLLHSTYISIPITWFLHHELFTKRTLDGWQINKNHWIVIIVKMEERNGYNIIDDAKYYIAISKNGCIQEQSMRNITNGLLDDELVNFAVGNFVEGILQAKFTAANCKKVKEEFSGSWQSICPYFQKLTVFQNEHDKFPLLDLVEFVIHAILCSPYVCQMCFQQIENIYGDAIKPFVCENKLCLYQYISLDVGTNVDAEIINNMKVVEMLVSFTYAAAQGNQFNPMPIGVGYMEGDDFVGFTEEKKETVAALVISTLRQLPSLEKVRKYLTTLETDPTVFKRKRSAKKYLDKINRLIYPLLSWIINSNKATFISLKENEKIGGVGNGPQFKMLMGTPQKEKAFQDALGNYGSIYAFHGSPLTNWHSIIRNGLHADYVLHGRLYGNGIYHAKDLVTSLSYATTARSSSSRSSRSSSRSWPSNLPRISSVVSLNELPNRKSEFQSNNPFLVVQHKEWVQTRYILLNPEVTDKSFIVPKMEEFTFEYPPIVQSDKDGLQDLIDEDEEDEDDDDTNIQKIEESTNNYSLLPPPEYATIATTKFLQKELIYLIKSQTEILDKDRYYIIDQSNLSNLYQWRVNITNLDKSSLLAQDMMKHGIFHISLEVRFGPDFPITPPFVRVIYPRFLPFCEGGGGHVTNGGSICMDLLTDSKWSPVYRMDAVFLQIYMAFMSTDPRPARLAQNFNVSYSGKEAVDAFIRVARDHGWHVPKGWDAYFN